MEKKYCSTHHLFYSVNECPMCMSERIANLEKMFVKKPQTIEIKPESKEITQESLKELMAKYNKR